MLEDLGIVVTIKVNTYASAAKGIANRTGLGKVRHIAVNQLWIQDSVAKGDLTIIKVSGKEHLADALTKHFNSEDIRVHLHKKGQSIEAGRHAIAPEDNRSGIQETNVNLPLASNAQPGRSSSGTPWGLCSALA